MLTIDKGEKLALEDIMTLSFVEEVAEIVAYSGIVGEPIDMQAQFEEEERQRAEKASKPKKKRKINPNRKMKGKTYIAKEGSSDDFWIRFGKDAYLYATDDDKFTESIIKGNYALVKKFLQNEWAEKEFFTRNEIDKAMSEAYPEIANNNSYGLFRLQHTDWAVGVFYKETNGVAVKPIYKKAGRGKYENIFYAGA